MGGSLDYKLSVRKKKIRQEQEVLKRFCDLEVDEWGKKIYKESGRFAKKAFLDGNNSKRNRWSSRRDYCSGRDRKSAERLISDGLDHDAGFKTRVDQVLVIKTTGQGGAPIAVKRNGYRMFDPDEFAEVIRQRR